MPARPPVSAMPIVLSRQLAPVSDASTRAGDLKAIVFDVDGTLYRQGPLRRAMAFRLLSAYATSPLIGWRTLATLQAYRRAQEYLRVHPSGDLAAAQIQLACERTTRDPDFVSASVQRWMEQEPLALLHRYVQPGLPGFLDACRERGLRLGVLSDYPVNAKLQALGVARYFEVALCAQAAEIGVFKPDPRGLHLAVERLCSSPRQTLYVGDRADVDVAVADAAGVRCAILTDQRAAAEPGGYLRVTGYSQLRAHLFGSD